MTPSQFRSEICVFLLLELPLPEESVEMIPRILLSLYVSIDLPDQVCL